MNDGLSLLPFAQTERQIDWISFAAGFMLAVVLVTVFLWLKKKKAARVEMRQVDRGSPQRPFAPPPPPVVLEGDLRAQVLVLRAEGRTIEAIKLVRIRLDCDLKSAKDAVEGLR
jgi:hypothetical protein